MVVRHGALKSLLAFFPAMPPSTVSGAVTNAQMIKMTQMVPKGSAAVLLYAMATVFRNENTMNIGPQNKKPVSNTLRTQFSPPICR